VKLDLALSIVAAGLVALAGFRLARGPVPHHPVESLRLLAAFDVDGSGRLEAPELDGRTPPGLGWTLHDLDGDGALDVREVEALVEDLDPLLLVREAE
jgi:hypothetical protein